MQCTWNLWHGCRKISAGCANCYVYRTDARFERDASAVKKTSAFRLPIAKNRAGEYKIPSGTLVYTCFTSDLFLDAADEWREEAWEMMRTRSDLEFFIITKRIDRFSECIPDDWGEGYENVTICSTCENQETADYRLPIYLSLPIKHKQIVCSPLLGEMDITPYLDGQIEQVTVGGESGPKARLCRYEWVLSLREQCKKRRVSFWFQQTGANFEKDGRVYFIRRKFQHSQAAKAGINLQF